MKYILKLMPVLAAAALTSACSSPGPTDKFLKSVPFQSTTADLYPASGYGSASFGPWVTASQQCGVRAPARVTIIRRPAHGRVSIRTKNGRLAFTPGSSLSRCDGRPMRGPFAVYTPNPGFQGQDTFSIRINFVNGEQRIIDARMNVH